MKLNNARWRNLFPKNPTQTAYLRFMPKPTGEIKTLYTESVKKFNKLDKDRLKTRFTDLIKEIGK